ncbi:MAG: hypothetical protein M1824_001914 [Vezdaea acicularis]|nr:MAG: hypothetical protein M1824_001914 [Vezdaea acicularis]
MAGEKGPIAAGPLKLKGVQSSRVEKKKKKKKKPKSDSNDKTPAAQSIDAVDIAKESDERKDITQAANEDEDEDEIDTPLSASKTEAQLKHEEMRRKRLDERLKREGIKTHKEKVEELNKYLSGLSEHHDMPRIGPG